MPYDKFIRQQIAGDLLQPKDPEQIDPEGLIATGLLAIADFVPGDVDKQRMIADYVNDQIDVVGRAILGLTLACARCHDHKFDPISTEDYYALAGIFFSTRLVPARSRATHRWCAPALVPPSELRDRAEAASDKRARPSCRSRFAWRSSAITGLTWSKDCFSRPNSTCLPPRTIANCRPMVVRQFQTFPPLGDWKKRS